MTSEISKLSLFVLFLLCSFNLSLLAQPGDPCETPMGLTAFNIESTTLEITWDIEGTATSYDYRYRRSDRTLWTTINFTTNLARISFLSRSTEYEVQVRSNCNGNSSDYSESILFITDDGCDLTIPTGVAANNISQTTAFITWDDQPDAASYQLISTNVATGGTQTIGGILNPEFALTNLDPSTTYEVSVSANCLPEVFGQYSEAIEFSTISIPLCGTPTSLIATEPFHWSLFDIAWVNPPEALSTDVQYRLVGETNWTLFNTLNNPQTLLSLSPSSDYEVQVRAVCADETSDFTESVFFTTLEGCDTPTNIVAGNVTSTSAELSWDNLAGALDWDFQYRLAGVTQWEFVGNTGSNTNTISDLLPNTEYEAQARAICITGASLFTEVISFTTLDTALECGDTPIINASNIDATSATISWAPMTGVVTHRYRYNPTAGGISIDGATTETFVNLVDLLEDTEYAISLRVVCSAGGSSPVTTFFFTTGLGGGVSCDIPTGLTTTGITTVEATLNWEVVNTALSYDYRYRETGTTTWTEANTTSVNVLLDGLISETNYEYQLQSVCDGEVSGYSASNTFTTTAPAVCEVPMGLVATAVTQSEATLNWDVVSSSLSYDYRYRPLTALNWIESNTSGNNILISNLLADTVYEFQVQAVCADGVSGYSTSSEFATVDNGGVFEDCDIAPQNVTASAISESTVTLSWNAVDPAQIDQYQYRYRLTSEGAWTNGTTTATSLNLSGLTPNTDYTFALRNNCTAGGNSPITTSTFTTGDNVATQALQYFPNPVRETLQVTASDASMVRVRIYDLHGALMKEITVSPNANEIDVGQLEKGLYLMEMVTDKQVEVKRFHKE